MRVMAAAVVLFLAAEPAVAAGAAESYRAVVWRYSHTVCWFNRSYSPGQCAWVADAVLRLSSAAGLDPRFVMAVLAAESAFNHSAVSRAGAIGFGQLMPSTARALGVDPYDPLGNLRGAVAKLAALAAEFRRADLVAAAYNAGSGAVRRWKGVPPYAETRGFVARVLELYRHFLAHPAWSPVW